ncbi:MAG: helix-turn-helix domain-containing protein [Candidatus Promineifilaceae bacterium]
MIPNRDLLHLLSETIDRLDDNQSLDLLAERAGWSKYGLHRAFKRTVGETPKQYVQRLRLERAGILLRMGKGSVLDIALASGFNSHEVFARAFQRQYNCSPLQYRNRTFQVSPEQADYPDSVASVGPCIRLFHIPLNPKSPRRSMMSTSEVVQKTLEEQPILFIQRRIPFTQLQATMADCFPKLYGHGIQAGLAIAGHPIARYVAAGSGLWTIDFVMPLSVAASAEGEMQAGVLYAGPVAFAVHSGEYDRLAETNAAIEMWIEANGLRTNGAPWESYVTDPGEKPDPKDWRTEVYWPILG